MYVRQPVTAALMFIRQTLVVDAHEMHQRGLDVVNVDFVFDNVVSVIVGCSVARSSFHTCTRHPKRETTWVVVAAKIRFRKLALAIIGSSKFATPNDQCVFQQPATF